MRIVWSNVSSIRQNEGLKPCLTFYPTYDWELAFHIYIYRVHWGTNPNHAGEEPDHAGEGTNPDR